MIEQNAPGDVRTATLALPPGAAPTTEMNSGRVVGVGVGLGVDVGVDVGVGVVEGGQHQSRIPDEKLIPMSTAPTNPTNTRRRSESSGGIAIPNRANPPPTTAATIRSTPATKMVSFTPFGRIPLGPIWQGLAHRSRAQPRRSTARVYAVHPRFVQWLGTC